MSINFYFNRDKIEKKDIFLDYMQSIDYIVDIFTKLLDRVLYEKNYILLNMYNFKNVAEMKQLKSIC